jgi:hypothetical protein
MATTDNSATDEKVGLRVEWLVSYGRETVRVLDCFGGEGVVWAAVSEACPDVRILRTGIERVKGKGDPNRTLYGDNLQWLPQIDLNEFDVVDLDAYGWPCRQVDMVQERFPSMPMFTTVGINGIGSVPHVAVEAAGMPPEWADLVPGPINKLAVEIWDAFLASRGYTEVRRAVFEKNGQNIGRAIMLYDYLPPVG